MEAVQDWALSVCMACVAAGILQQFASDKARFSVIKLVLTLYILVTAFALLRALRYTELHLAVPEAAEASSAEVNVSALAMDTAAQTLEQTLQKACAAQGLAVSAIEVSLSGEADNVAVAGVRVVSEEERTAVEQAVCGALGTQVPVDVVAEGSEENGA